MLELLLIEEKEISKVIVRLDKRIKKMVHRTEQGRTERIYEEKETIGLEKFF